MNPLRRFYKMPKVERDDNTELVARISKAVLNLNAALALVAPQGKRVRTDA